MEEVTADNYDGRHPIGDGGDKHEERHGGVTATGSRGRC